MTATSLHLTCIRVFVSFLPHAQHVYIHLADLEQKDVHDRVSGCSMQELLQQSAVPAQAALLQFQSCVRTTLLLSHGYECQEKV